MMKLPGVCYTLVILFTLGCCVMLIATVFDCEQEVTRQSPPSVELRFQVGTMIHLKIGGYGQIVGINTNTPNTTYHVRVNTYNGPKLVSFECYELEIKP